MRKPRPALVGADQGRAGQDGIGAREPARNRHGTRISNVATTNAPTAPASAFLSHVVQISSTRTRPDILNPSELG